MVEISTVKSKPTTLDIPAKADRLLFGLPITGASLLWPLQEMSHRGKCPGKDLLTSARQWESIRWLGFWSPQNPRLHDLQVAPPSLCLSELTPAIKRSNSIPDGAAPSACWQAEDVNSDFQRIHEGDNLV